MTNELTTKERNFLDALQHSLKKRTLVVRIDSFEGWKDGCDCKDCRSQRVIFEFIFGEGERSPNGFGAIPKGAYKDD